jgi:NitT/TauT family transport system ATP-binding protein
MTKGAIRVSRLRKVFGTGQRKIEALSSIDLDIPAGCFTTLIGASGCGKSTLLRMIAGLESATEGAIEINGSIVADPGPDRAVVFQSYSLYPWLTVAENIAFSSRLKVNKNNVRDPKPGSIDDRARSLLNLVGLEPFADSYPNQLSGGMQQRVAIARSLLQRPPILLMDEPFGALDAQTRELMQDLLLHVVEVERSTVLFVTHDVEEAVYLGDRVVVMAPHPGRIDSVHVIDQTRRRTQDSKLEPVFLSHLRTIRHRIKETSTMSIDDGMLEALSLGGPS